MQSERIEQVFPPGIDSRFLIIYGKGVDDTFISPRLEELRLENLLLHRLKKQSYRRVVFYSSHRSLYFLDEESKSLSRQGPDSTTSVPPQTLRRNNSGPLGEINLLKDSQASRSSNASPMGDLHAVRAMDSMLKQSQIPTAAIITQAETSLKFFEDQRTLAGLVGDWSRIPASNQNMCIFLFSVDTFSGLMELINALPVPEIRHYLKQQQGSMGRQVNIIQVNGPGIKEISDAVALIVRSKHLAVRKEDMEKLTPWMVAEDLQINQWVKKLLAIPLLSIDNAIHNHWFVSRKPNKTSALRRLQAMTGLEQVKRRIHEISSFAKLAETNPQFADHPPTLHMLFTGNPGTGKTTVARLFGEILQDLGMLRRGHVVEVKAADLVADHVGGTALKTSAIIHEALDGLLFIDEAYALTEEERGKFGHEALETIMTAMEDYRHRLVVIAAGYPAKMEKFLSFNPGLRRRIPKDNLIYFPNYSAGELMLILDKMIKRKKLVLSEAARSALGTIILGLLDQADEKFGNAGEMRNLTDGILRRYADRRVNNKGDDNTEILLVDIPDEYQAYLPAPVPDIDALFQDLDQLIGLENIKQFLTRMVKKLQLDQLRQSHAGNETPSYTLPHLVFYGSPGTGKTTVARLVGKFFQSLGMLRKGHVVEVTRQDLIAGYVGQTALKTQDRITEAMDGVLFIDEAYSLLRGGEQDFGREAIDTLVKSMEMHQKRLVVVAAGYQAQMEGFLNSNPGLKSRFSPPLLFSDYSSPQLVEILAYYANKENYELTPDAGIKLMELFDHLRLKEGSYFGNARTAMQVFEEMKANLAERVLSKAHPNPASLDIFIEQDVPSAAFMLQSTSAQPDHANNLLPGSHNQTDFLDKASHGG